MEAEIDSIGRILIPEFLAERAKLSGRVAIVGVQGRAEIWDEKAWRSYKEEVEHKADALAEKLGQVGVL